MSFHSTTRCAWYKERGPTHRFCFGASRPAGDLPGDMTGTFGLASRISVRTRQAGQAHVRAQPTSMGAIVVLQRQTACSASDVTRRRAAALGGRDGKGRAGRPTRPNARACCVLECYSRRPWTAMQSQMHEVHAGTTGGQCGNAESRAVTAPRRWQCSKRDLHAF